MQEVDVPGLLASLVLYGADDIAIEQAALTASGEEVIIIFSVDGELCPYVHEIERAS